MSKKNKTAPDPIGTQQGGTQQAPWQDIVVLCSKCGGKLDGGFGDQGRDDLRSVLRAGLRDAGRKRDFRIIETGCLGVCPKGGVAALRGSEPGRILIVPQGQAAGGLLETFGVRPPPLA